MAKIRFPLILGSLLWLGCGQLPHPTVTRTNDQVIIGVQTLGEYPSHVERIRLMGRATGGVIWELRASEGRPRIWKVQLQPGDNAVAVSAIDGRYEVVVPSKGTSFHLKAGQEYVIEFWAPGRDDARSVGFTL